MFVEDDSEQTMYIIEKLGINSYRVRSLRLLENCISELITLCLNLLYSLRTQITIMCILQGLLTWGLVASHQKGSELGIIEMLLTEL